MNPVQASSKTTYTPPQTSFYSTAIKNVAWLTAGAMIAGVGLILNTPLAIASGLLVGTGGVVYQSFGSARSSRSVQQIRDDNVQIFKETCDTISRGQYQSPSGRTIHLDAARQTRMIGNTKPYSSTSSLKCLNKNYHTKITVENRTTLKMTEKLLQEGLNPLVLDMANRYIPGGGVLHGSSAQEETLCRQSNLYEALRNRAWWRFPFHELGGIYVPEVQFFRADPSENYAFLEKPVTAAVFASAAYDTVHNKKYGGRDRPKDEKVYRENTKEKMRTMLRVALIKGHDSVVLSAYGCGAFGNDPKLIASLYKDVFAEPEFAGQFKKIAFGIVNDYNSSVNYSTFRKAFHWF
jgi:uncharacterized protein (TIGR02452 family)